MPSVRESLTGQPTRYGHTRHDHTQLTAAGRRRLAVDRAGWREFAAAVTTVLEGPPWPARS